MRPILQAPEMKPLRRLESYRFFFTLCLAFLFTRMSDPARTPSPFQERQQWVGLGLPSCLSLFEIRVSRLLCCGGAHAGVWCAYTPEGVRR